MPPKFETIMEDADVQVGETCRLAVVVEGKPDPDILWYKVRRLFLLQGQFRNVTVGQRWQNHSHSVLE